MKKIFTFFVLALSFCLILPVSSQNLIAGWSGNGVTGDLSKPSDVGWINAPATTASLWNTANASGGCRFRDSGVTGGYTANSIYYEDSTSTYLTSRLMMIRWDNASYSSSYYAFPVTLEANTTYTFSMDYYYGGSGSAGLTLTAAFSTTVDKIGQISVKTFTSTTVNVIRRGEITFTSGAAGTYYLTYNGAWAWFGIANLSLVKSKDQLTELNAQMANLTLGNLAAVTTNLTLPTTAGTNGVTVRWATSRPDVIDTLGNVTRPEIYDVNVALTATLSQLLGTKSYSVTKTFNAKVLGLKGTPDQIAEWNFAGNLITESNGTFTVKDKQSGFVGTIMNEARIRTIGTSTQYNVLDLGNGTGYFDMGTEIGKAIYSLSNYSMCGYFRIDADYPSINSNGNFYWTFSNTPDVMTDKTGYIIGSLKAQSQSVSSSYYGAGNQAVGSGTNAPLGGWHHFAYTQNGTTGTILIDGSIVSTGEVTNLPSTTLTRDGLTGTLYNWLGRSNYVSDVYLRKTLLWDFQLLSIPLTADDLNFGFEVPATLDKLNIAYGENPDYILPELTSEKDKLALGDLSAVTSNIALPTQASDPTVSISWKSSNPNLIDGSGVVTRPNYYSYPDTLTATLSKNGQKVFKIFPALVVVKDGSQYTNNLLVKYDFSTVTDSVVTDVAEKHLIGVLKNTATIKSIGNQIKYNVLSLGDSIGYFDMGAEVGKLMYNLTDFTIGAYYRVDTAYTSASLSSNGNFLWNFSNSKDIINNPTGYLIGSLKNHAETISPTNWSLEQTVTFASPALKGSWHHFAYTQNGTNGTVYVDGMPVQTGAVVGLPNSILPKAGFLGTIYNWIGRSCYVGDVYLRKTLVYDFRLYKTALTDEQIQNSVLNVGATISSLDAAYEQTPNALKSVLNTSYKVISTEGAIKISGLNGRERVSLYDFTGRQLRINNPSLILANKGVYIVRIDNFATKVVVR